MIGGMTKKPFINVFELELSDEHMAQVYRFRGLGPFDRAQWQRMRDYVLAKLEKEDTMVTRYTKNGFAYQGRPYSKKELWEIERTLYDTPIGVARAVRPPQPAKAEQPPAEAPREQEQPAGGRSNRGPRR